MELEKSMKDNSLIEEKAGWRKRDTGEEHSTASFGVINIEHLEEVEEHHTRSVKMLHTCNFQGVRRAREGRSDKIQKYNMTFMMCTSRKPLTIASG